MSTPRIEAATGTLWITDDVALKGGDAPDVLAPLRGHLTNSRGKTQAKTFFRSGIETSRAHAALSCIFRLDRLQSATILLENRDIPAPPHRAAMLAEIAEDSLGPPAHTKANHRGLASIILEGSRRDGWLWNLERKEWRFPWGSVIVDYNGMWEDTFLLIEWTSK